MPTPRIDVLQDSLRHQLEIKKGLEQKASFLTALSGVMVGFSVGRLDGLEFRVLAVTGFLTVVLSILSVFLQYRGPGGRGSLLCWWGFPRKEADYRQSLNKVLENETKIVGEYEKEIWALSAYSIRPKTNLLTMASTVLLGGLVVSFILFLI